MVYGFWLLVISTPLVWLLWLWRSVLESTLLVVFESLGILRISLLLELFGTISILFYLLDKVAKFG